MFRPSPSWTERVGAPVVLHLDSMPKLSRLCAQGPNLPSLRSVRGQSDIGRIRRRNEDALALNGSSGVAVVADGMGGHPGGDVASRLAVSATADALADAMQGCPDPAGFVAHMRAIMLDAVLGAHATIRERGVQEPHLNGMGTTLTAMVTHPDTGAWVIGHVGDSRAYRIHGETMDQVTRDDTWIQQQIENNPDLDPARARHSPYAHLLTQCLGLEDTPTPQILDGTAAPGDRFLLCSDGLVGMLEDDTMLSILAQAFSENGADPAAPLLNLVEAANEAGGHDNITAVLVSFESN